MHTFVLVPGAGGRAWYWHRVVDELGRRGYRAVAVDLPAADETAGLREYVDVVTAAVGDRTPLVVVGQSMGALTAALVCDRLAVDLLVLVNAMVPRPGETPAAWWEETGHGAARIAQARREGFEPDMDEAFLHDLPPDVRAGAEAAGSPEQSGTPFRAALAAAGVARGVDPVPAGPPRPVLPAGVPASGRRAAAGGARRRDGRRASDGAESARRAHRTAARVPARGDRMIRAKR